MHLVICPFNYTPSPPFFQGEKRIPAPPQNRQRKTLTRAVRKKTETRTDFYRERPKRNTVFYRKKPKHRTDFSPTPRRPPKHTKGQNELFTIHKKAKKTRPRVCLFCGNIPFLSPTVFFRFSLVCFILPTVSLPLVFLLTVLPGLPSCFVLYAKSSFCKKTKPQLQIKSQNAFQPASETAFFNFVR